MGQHPTHTDNPDLRWLGFEGSFISSSTAMATLEKPTDFCSIYSPSRHESPRTHGTPEQMHLGLNGVPAKIRVTGRDLLGFVDSAFPLEFCNG